MNRDEKQLTAIRLRNSSDIPQAAAALVSVHDVDGYPVEGVDHPEVWLSPNGLLKAWVAVREGRVVGHVAVTRPTGESAVALWVSQSGEVENAVGVLARLFVAPDARKQATGERLVRAAESYAQAHGLRLVLDVMRKDLSAIRLYRRLGWLELGPIAHRFGEGQQTEAVAYVSPGAEDHTERHGRQPFGSSLRER
ncbi:GNAT family N-acetyltransferase [Streptomyces sp. JNUCC 64]